MDSKKLEKLKKIINYCLFYTWGPMTKKRKNYNIWQINKMRHSVMAERRCAYFHK